MLLGAVPLAYGTGLLTPAVYLDLLGASSLPHAWGKAGKHGLFVRPLSEGQRLTAGSVLRTSLWSATIAGPVLAGLLVGVVSSVWIIGADAATFAVLAVRGCAAGVGHSAAPAGAPRTPRR